MATTSVAPKLKPQLDGDGEAIETAKRVLQVERDSIDALIGTIDDQFQAAIELIAASESYVIVTGVGKSGHIGQKIAASFASTGTPSFFLHPTEASHGDLGVIVPGAVVLAISYSGESRELVDVLRFCQTRNVPVVGMTRSKTSTLGRLSEIVLELPTVQEACPNGLAPTSSTTITLALGDAIMIALMAKRGFGRDDFGERHPGGKLGKSLHTVADYLAIRTEDLPTIRDDASIEDVIIGLTVGRKGCLGVLDEQGIFSGIITDGDLRRAFASGLEGKTAIDIMTSDPITFSETDRMAGVVQVMTENRISNGFVLNDGRPVGVVHLKDLLADGYV